MKRFLAIAPIVVFALVLVGFMVGLRRDPTLLPSMMIGKLAPAFDLPPVRAEAVGLASSDLKGEPMLLNVFASWCVTCRIEHPMLMQLRAQGVTIHGLDWKDRRDAGAKWLADFGDPYIRVGSDENGRTGIDMGVSAAPETFVIDKTGRVRYRHVGAITPRVWAETLSPLMARLRAES